MQQKRRKTTMAALETT
jgi:hypothetical protein